MGTYRLHASANEVLEWIRAFARDEGLGEILVQHREEQVEAVASTASDSENVRCSWVCEDEAGQCVVEMKVRASRRQTTALYLGLSVAAFGLAAIGILLLVGGLDAVPCILLPLIVGAVGLFLVYRLRCDDTVLSIVDFERRFAERLASRTPQTERPPNPELIPFAAQIGLMLFPMGLCLAGVTRVCPPLSIPAIPWLLSMIGRSWAERAGGESPFLAWRLLLSEWLSSRYIMCYFALLAVAIFMICGSALFLIQKPDGFGVADFGAALQLRLDTAPEGQTTGDPLASDATILRNVLAKPDFKDAAPSILMGIQIARAALCCLCAWLFLWGAKGIVDWLRKWGLARSGPGPSLSPPPVGAANSLPMGARLGMLLSLIFALVGNVLHLAVTLEATSVLLRGCSAFNFTVAQAIGWMVLNLDAAANGQVQLNPYCLAFLLLLLSPTLLTMIGWILFALRSLFVFLRMLLAPTDAALQNTATKLASTLGVRPPMIRIIRGRLRIEAHVPWFPGSSTILVTRAAARTLSEPELASALAHEVAHVKHDATALRWTRWLSFLSLFPCNVFALLLDTEYREKRADAVAARLVGDSNALATALVKVSLGNVFQINRHRAGANTERLRAATSSLHKLVDRLFAYLSLFGLLLQPELALGYVHPRLQDRLETLDENETSDTKTP
jgi:Zn-dependent protease with chaperone function